MSKIRVTDISMAEGPQPFRAPFLMRITFESCERLPEPLEWRVIYVGSAESAEHDQVLENVMIPVTEAGALCFDLQADPPDHSLIPSPNDLLGPSLIMIAALYNGAEFFRCSYFVYNNYAENADPAQDFDVGLVTRSVLTAGPRIRTSDIDWDFERTQHLAEAIKLSNQEELRRLREQNLRLFAEYPDPFGLNENSFLQSSDFLNN